MLSTEGTLIFEPRVAPTPTPPPPFPASADLSAETVLVYRQSLIGGCVGCQSIIIAINASFALAAAAVGRLLGMHHSGFRRPQ